MYKGETIVRDDGGVNIGVRIVGGGKRSFLEVWGG
jgi:hypothetical protein